MYLVLKTFIHYNKLFIFPFKLILSAQRNGWITLVSDERQMTHRKMQAGRSAAEDAVSLWVRAGHYRNVTYNVKFSFIKWKDCTYCKMSPWPVNRYSGFWKWDNREDQWSKLKFYVVYWDNYDLHKIILNSSFESLPLSNV